MLGMPKILNLSCRRKDKLRQILIDLLKDGTNDINGLSDNISIQGEEIQTARIHDERQYVETSLFGLHLCLTRTFIVNKTRNSNNDEIYKMLKDVLGL